MFDNDLFYQIKYDSIYGKLDGLAIKDNIISFRSKKIQIVKPDLLNNDFKKIKTDYIIDCTGTNISRNKIEKLIKNKICKKYFVTHSTDKSDIEVINGINDKSISKDTKLISTSICDTTAMVHILNFLEQKYRIINGHAITLHPFLNYQKLLDGNVSTQSIKNQFYIKEPTLNRSIVNNLIPKSTSALDALNRVLPETAKKLTSNSIRVPTSIVSNFQLVVNINKKNLSIANIIKDISLYFKNDQNVEISSDPLTSIDFIGNKASLVIDTNWIKSNENLLSFTGWYDNECGYVNSVIRLLKSVS